MTYPMRSHGISEGENNTYHLRQTMEKFWLTNLPAGGKERIIKIIMFVVSDKILYICINVIYE